MLTIEGDEHKIEWDLLGRIHYSREGRKFVLLYSQLEKSLVESETAALKLVGAIEVANDEATGLGSYGRSSIFLLAETTNDIITGALSIGPAVTLSIVDGNLRKAFGAQSTVKLIGESKFLYGGMVLDYYLYPKGESDLDQQLMNYQASGATMNFMSGVKIPKLGLKIGGEWQIGQSGDAFSSYVGVRATKKF